MFQTSVPEATDRSRDWQHASDRHINTAGCCHPRIDSAPAKTKPHLTILTAASVQISLHTVPLRKAVIKNGSFDLLPTLLMTR